MNLSNKDDFAAFTTKGLRGGRVVGGDVKGLDFFKNHTFGKVFNNDL